MKQILIFAVLLFAVSAGHAESTGEKKQITAVVAKDADSKPATKFSADEAKIVAFWISDGVKVGDKIRGVLVAEDVGDVVPKNTSVLEDTITATKADEKGSFTFSKPTAGWPVGKYRVEIYNGETLEESISFTVEAKE